jgi:hypothetical protein
MMVRSPIIFCYDNELQIKLRSGKEVHTDVNIVPDCMAYGLLDESIHARSRNGDVLEIVCFQVKCKCRLLESAAESGPGIYIHVPASQQAQVRWSPQQQELGPNSTQKTSLLGEDCPHLYVVLPHHQFPMWD